jgi:hypothetical protein
MADNEDDLVDYDEEEVRSSDGDSMRSGTRRMNGSEKTGGHTAGIYFAPAEKGRV